MQNLLNTLLSRWEIDPPIFHAPETARWTKEDWSFIEKHRLLRELEPAGSANCRDCSRRYEVEYICDRDGNQRGYIHCDDCGLEPVEPDRLKRWELDTPAMLQSVFSDLKLSLEVVESNCLWRVGRATWAGRSRRLWFVRSSPSHCSDAIDVLKRNPKAVVFAPTKEIAARWQDATNTFVHSLEDTTAIKTDRLVLDTDEIETRISDIGDGGQNPRKKQIKKRGDRLASAERIRNELIAHLRAANEHAYSLRELTGTPVLMKPPTQKMLASMTGLSNSTVSRCLGDNGIPELQFYWETAHDLDRIMTFKGPLERGGET